MRSSTSEFKGSKGKTSPSEKLFFRTRSLPSLDSPRDFRTPIPTKDRNIASATAPNFLGCSASSHGRPTAGVLKPLPGTASPQEPPLLPSLTSVQILLFASFCGLASHMVVVRRPAIFEVFWERFLWRENLPQNPERRPVQSSIGVSPVQRSHLSRSFPW